MKKVTLILLFLCAYHVSFAQDYDFGKVSKEELNEKVCTIDSSANAAVLYKNEKITFDYQLSDAIEEIGDKLYFSPMLFLASSENPFKQDKRNYPITIDFPITTRYMVNIMLPDGYAIESLPESSGVEFNNGAAKFNYVIKENGKFLQVIVNFDLNTTLVLPEDYNYFKQFYKTSLEKQNEKVVLKKI